jgi:serine protease AprX
MNNIAMPHTITSSLTKQPNAGLHCPVCELYHPNLVHCFNPVYEADIIHSINDFLPAWKPADGICSRCFDEFDAITYHNYRGMEKSVEAFKLKYLDFYILPIPERLNADESFTGKGVTICFIDSGFFLHPDIKESVKHVMDITNEANTVEYFTHPNENAWHGTMTATVCAGNGKLSNGLYRGLAKDAELVLIKTQNEQGKIIDENITKALKWVLQNHKEHNIKIVNLSLSGDVDAPLYLNEINTLAEKLFQENVLVIAAVGNNENGNILPPASSPHVVAVGGLDDQNKLDGDIILYHSTYGVTIDGLSKPELISNAIWLPAPILPGTKTHKKATVFFKALDNEDYLSAIIQNNAELLKEEHINLFEGKEKIWKEVKKIVWKEKFISPDYMHVDGTSFAAPIVSSVAAQMIEANPSITANEIRKILLQTALPLPSYDIARQGYGRLHPKMAVYAVMQRQPMNFTDDNPIINKQSKRATFYIQFANVKTSVSLVSSFNNWKPNEILLKPSANDTWYVDIPLLPEGKHEYKFFVDNSYWIEDISNPWRVIDNHGGWNNVFEINEN